MTQKSDRGFVLKIVIPAIITLILFIVSLYFIVFPTYKNGLLAEKKEMTQELVGSAISIIKSYDEDYQDGLITLDQAKASAKRRIEDMRYGKESKDYFWITDMHPIMIMHPYRKDLNNTDVSSFSDPNGVKLFVDAVKLVKKSDEGYIEYVWQWKDNPNKLSHKLSFVKKCDRWDWIVGTGLYVDDLYSEINRFRMQLMYISIFITLVISIAIYYIVHQSHIIENKRKAASQKLLNTQRLLQSSIEQSPAGIIIATAPDIKIVTVNEAARKIRGKTKFALRNLAHLKDESNWNIYHKNGTPLREEELPLTRAIKLGKQYVNFEAIIKTSSNGDRSVLINASPIISSNGEIRAGMVIFDDVTDQKQAEKSLRSFDQSLQKATITAQEREQNRLAKELHDGLGPILSTVKLYFQWLSESPTEEKKKLIVEKGNTNINEAIHTLREISNNLSPHVLTNFGLTEAIKIFINNIPERIRIKINFGNSIKIRLKSDIELSLYRVITELINNSIKHANASSINILINRTKHTLFVYYSDDGIGFDTEKASIEGKGLGLLNIQNRIRSINGDITTVSEPNKGVQVKIIIDE